MVAKRFRLALSTAYGQLILLVFLPISVLATVGGFLVLSDTSQAARAIQQADAERLLTRYQMVVSPLQADLTALNRSISDPTAENALSSAKRTELQNRVTEQLQRQVMDKHLQGMAIVNEKQQVLLQVGNVYPTPPANLAVSFPLNPPASTLAIQSITSLGASTPLLQQLSQQSTSLFRSGDSTLYGEKLNFSEPLPTTANLTSDLTPLWLVVNIDNEPLQIARYQVLIALAITGLLTILLLLLTLNIYARRWIAPIYEMRLHLQRTNANNLYQPLNVRASGEINQLQQDLVKTLRRLHTSFQEIKSHAEQTEDDLRLAFDEMEMQNISIRNARDAAVSASQTKSAFLANISHELRTPLNSIDGFINLLSRNGGLSAEQDLYVQTIRKSSAHLLALVNDVLDFSKIEAGKLVLDRHEFDLYASIYDVVDMLSPLAAEKGLRLAVFFYDDVPHQLIGDALRVKQVLTNLVNNAIKFTDDGEVVVRVSLDEAEDDSVYISVSDTGRGISPEHQKALFQSFSQGDPSITRQYGGTGLGLVISKQLTFLMGGQIGFFDNAAEHSEAPASRPKGTTFWFRLPIEVSPQESQRLASQSPMWQLPMLGNPHSPVDPSNAVQLLAWLDHPASVQVLKGSLRALPIAITWVSSLAGLLESLKERGNQWDWVIVDHHTTEDTRSLLKQVRLHYAGKLALYGYQVNLDTELLAQYQARALYQPIDRRQLYQLLDNDQRTPPAPVLPQWHGFKVLAVDDHLPNLLVLEALLVELGISVVTVSSGFDAIDYIRQRQPIADDAVDLIFMDIQMPRMSGSEAARQIRQLETEQGNKHLPIIALTAHSLSDERDNLLASGIDDYVGKPINHAQLQQILQRWLGQHSNAVNPTQNDTPVSHHTAALMVQEPKTMAETSPFTERGLTTITPPAPLDSLAVIDWADAVNRVGGKVDLASNLITLLIDSIEQEKTDLAAAWHAHDRQALSHVAHRILGASRYTGVPQLRYASQNLEDKCLLSVSNSSPAQFAMLTPFYEQLMTALSNLQQADLSHYPELQYAQLKEHEMTWKMI